MADPEPTPAPAAQPVEPEPLRISFDMAALSAGDLEDMEDYCGPEALQGKPVLGMLQEAFRKVEGSDNEFGELIGALPTKLLTAVLGVFRRHQDPSFGPQRWREMKLTALMGDARPPGQPAPPTPISRARTGTRGGQRGNGKRSSKRT